MVIQRIQGLAVQKKNNFFKKKTPIFLKEICGFGKLHAKMVPSSEKFCYTTKCEWNFFDTLRL